MPNDKIEQRNVYRDKRQSHLREALIFSIQRVKILIMRQNVNWKKKRVIVQKLGNRSGIFLHLPDIAMKNCTFILPKIWNLLENILMRVKL